MSLPTLCFCSLTKNRKKEVWETWILVAALGPVYLPAPAFHEAEDQGSGAEDAFGWEDYFGGGDQIQSKW